MQLLGQPRLNAIYDASGFATTMRYDGTAAISKIDRPQQQQLRETVRGDANLLPPILEALRDRSSLGEVCGALRDVFGDYRPDI